MTAQRSQDDGQVRVGTRAPLEHLPGLDGIRGIAIALVVLYHAGLGVPGGYVGVDVFFVLSGFLITRLLVAELSPGGTIDAIAFYARRARRLLPAAFVVLLATIAGALVLLPAYRLPAVLADVASAAGYVSNIRFGALANDYFQATAAPSLALHFWSLSLEEQFYFAWPALLYLATRRTSGPRHRRARLIVLLVGLSVASLAICIRLTDVDQPWAFYLLPTRAWELAGGGLLAVAAAAIGSRIRDAAGIAGLVAIAAAAMLLDDNAAFPGVVALAPALGAAALIVAASGPSRIARLLELGPLRWLGRISYSLYLWHWPILQLGAAAAPWIAPPVLAAGAVAVAAASERWIERPFRAGTFVGLAPRRNVLQAGASIVAVLAVCLAFNPAPAAASASFTPPLNDLLAGTIAPCPEPSSGCVLGDAAGARTMAVFGDSHAESWLPALDELGRQRGWRVLNLTFGGCPSTEVRIWSDTLKRERVECVAWRAAAIARIDQERPELVVVANTSQAILVDDAGGRARAAIPLGEPWRSLWTRGLETTLSRAAAEGRRIVVLGDVPTPRWAALDPAACLAGATPASCSADPALIVPRDFLALERAIATSSGATFVDPTAWLCRDRCRASIAGVVVYSDQSGHLTAPFVESLEPELATAIGL